MALASSKTAKFEGIDPPLEWFGVCFAQAAVGMSVCTLDGRILQVNPALCAVLNRSESALLGSRLTDLTHSEDVKTKLGLVDRLRSGQIPSFVNELRYITPQGHAVWVRESVSLVRDEGGIPTSIVILSEDINQRKRAEATERERIGLKETVASMERVLGIVAHELRTPLASMRAMAELLLLPGGREEKQAEEYLRRLHDEAIRMSHTIDSLLEAARLNSGHAKWNWSRFGLKSICSAAVESIRPLADDAVEFAIVIDEEVGMRGDADAIRRLLLNLLSNARKHTPTGRIEVGAAAQRHNGNDWIELRVSDGGRGIDPELLCKLGEAFALNSGVVGANHVSGTGLGLAICKSIAEAHGGSISIRSTPGHGTTVTALVRADLSAACSKSQQARAIASAA